MITHPVTKEKGRLRYFDRPTLDQQIAALPDGEYEISIGKKKKRRTSQQNRGVRGVWVPDICRELGYHPHDEQFLYDQIKMQIGWTETKANPLTGEAVTVPRPTKDCTMQEYSEFMEAFRGFVEDPDSGLGIRLKNLDPMKARI